MTTARILAICCSLMLSVAAVAQEPLALPDAMADAATPNGKVVVEFFKAVTEGRIREGFDKYWGDDSIKEKNIAATAELFKKYPDLRNETIAIVARGDWVFMQVVETGMGPPRLTNRAELVIDGRIVKHKVTGMVPLGKVQEISDRLTGK